MIAEQDKKTFALAQYNRPGWTVVRLANYFEQNNIDSWQAKELIDTIYKDWCEGNVYLDGWQQNGATRYSYRFQFADAMDALAFKLRFGIV